MIQKRFLFGLIFLGFSFFSSLPAQVKFNIIQINDVYEVGGLQNGKIGDMARLATLKKRYLKKNPNTFLILSGDFVSPSALNKVQFEGENLEGRQMVDVMNKTGVDIVTFGNHEFDIKENFLQKRIDESRFSWICANAFHIHNGDTTLFTKTISNNVYDIEGSMIQSFHNKKNEEITLGWMGLVIPFNKANYVTYEDPIHAAAGQMKKLESASCDVRIGITHLSREMDSTLAQKVPGFDLILGGHEHEWMKFYSGKTLITKADANAKTAWIHQLNWNPETKQIKIKSKLVPINEKIAADPEVEKAVKYWMDVAFESMKKSGFDPAEVVLNTSEELDGRETSMRNHPTNLGSLIADACKAFSPGSDAVAYNSGSVRVDDILTGEITQYDILRTLPFGGAMLEIKLSGLDLKKMLQIGTITNKGLGGYLQLSNLSPDGNNWLIGGKIIDDSGSYKILVSTFLASGGESNFGWLKDYPSVIPTGTKAGVINDIRNITIDYLKTHKIGE